MVAIRAAGGGIDFLVQAGLRGRRRRHVVAPAGPMLAS
jgi:hypothetical protein